MIRTTVPGKHTSGLQGYLDYYTDDPSLKSAGDINGLFCGKPGYVTMIGKKDVLGFFTHDPIKDFINTR